MLKKVIFAAFLAVAALSSRNVLIFLFEACCWRLLKSKNPIAYQRWEFQNCWNKSQARFPIQEEFTIGKTNICWATSCSRYELQDGVWVTSRVIWDYCICSTLDRNIWGNLSTVDCWSSLIDKVFINCMWCKNIKLKLVGYWIF